MEISHRVRELLAEHLGVPFDDVQPGMNLVADLGADSLDEVGLVMAMEEAFNVDIDDVAGDPKSEAVKSGRLKPWRTAAECIQWEIPAPSIFERKKALAEATQRRIFKGISRYVVDAADPFIVTYYGDKGVVGEFRGQSVDEPLRTQTTENRHGIVVPFISSSAYSKTTGRGEYIYHPEEPVRTITASNDKILVAPRLAPFITECANASSPRVMPIDEPLRTVCAETKGGHFALASANVRAREEVGIA